MENLSKFVLELQKYIQELKNNIQGRRKQYGLKHNVSGTIHGAIGDTLEWIVTMLSVVDKNFSLW